MRHSWLIPLLFAIAVGALEVLGPPPVGKTCVSSSCRWDHAQRLAQSAD